MKGKKEIEEEANITVNLGVQFSKRRTAMRKIVFTERGRAVKRWDRGSSELWQVKGIVNIRQIIKIIQSQPTRVSNANINFFKHIKAEDQREKHLAMVV